MKHLWERIVSWHRQHMPEDRTPPDQPLLRSGAPEAGIRDLESALGVSLPSDVRESYLCYDGSAERYAILPWGFYLLSLHAILEHWNMWKRHLDSGLFAGMAAEPAGPIRAVHWNLRWIPISHNGGGDHHCIDLNPDVGGSDGQVIKFNHEIGPVRILAAGFRQWIENYAHDLESGEYIYDPFDCYVVPKNESS